MDYKDFSWKMFEKTGDINMYLAFRESCFEDCPAQDEQTDAREAELSVR